MQLRQQIVEKTMTEGVSVIRSAVMKNEFTFQNKRSLRVAAYCRVSKDIEEQESSMATQMSAYERLITQHPEWTLVGIYADKGKTGTNTKKRTEYMRMIEDAMAGQIDLILVKSVSRFSRNTVDLLKTIRDLRQHGVGVYFEKENIDTSSLSSELLLTVFAAFAQEESFSISENMRRGMRQRFKLGIPKVSQVYGYDNLERGVLTVNDEKGEVVRRIFSMYINGASTIEIADTLNREGIKPPIESGDGWYHNSVKCILKNEKYVGDSLMQKYYTSNHLEHDSTPNKDLVVEQYYKEGTHDALVDRDVYEDANRVMMMRDNKRGACQYPYYGKLICPHCGKPMVKVNIKHGKIPSCWICGGEDKGELYHERTDCPIYWVKEPYLSEAVLKAIEGLDDTRYDVRWVKKQIEKKPTVEFGYLRRLVEYITFDGWDTLKVKWLWGEETRIPYVVKRATDYPDPTYEGGRIGPFALGQKSMARVMQSNEEVKRIIGDTRIIADTTHRFSCPPFVVSATKKQAKVKEDEKTEVNVVETAE